MTANGLLAPLQKSLIRNQHISLDNSRSDLTELKRALVEKSLIVLGEKAKEDWKCQRVEC